MDPKISIIIPCYNAKGIVIECLESVLNQETCFGYEVIVVDSSQDETPLLIQQKFPVVKLIHLEKRTFPGSARNIGVDHSKGEIIMFIDAHCIAQKDWVDKTIRAHQEGYAAVGGAIVNGTSDSVVGTAEYLLEFNEFIPSSPKRKTRFIPTANSSFAKDIFSKYGKFEETQRASEDVLFGQRIVEKGGIILFDPAIRVYHANRTKFKHFLMHQLDLGKGAALARRKNPHLPGAFLMKVPGLILLLPLVKFMRISWRLLKWNPKLFLSLVLMFPLVFAGLCSYSLGFLKGAIEY